LVIYMDYRSLVMGTRILPLTCGPAMRIVPAVVMLFLVVRSLRTLAPATATPVDDLIDA